MQRSLLVACLWVLLLMSGCPNPVAQEADCTVGQTRGDGDAREVCVAGRTHHIHVKLVQQDGVAQRLTERDVRSRLAQVNSYANAADSGSDIACCIKFDLASFTPVFTNDSTRYGPANSGETGLLLSPLNDEGATLLLLDRIGGCSVPHMGGIVGCANIGTGRAAVEWDAPPEAWLHELLHAMNVSHVATNDPRCARGTSVDDKWVMCDRAPAGRVLRQSDCSALMNWNWSVPGSIGSSEDNLACWGIP